MELHTYCPKYPDSKGRVIAAFNFCNVRTGEKCRPKYITRLSAEIQKSASGFEDVLYCFGNYKYSNVLCAYTVVSKYLPKTEILLKPFDFEDLFVFHKSFVREHWGFGKAVMCYNDTCIYMYNRMCGYTIIVLGNVSEGDERIEQILKGYAEKGFASGIGFIIPESDNPYALQKHLSASAAESVTLTFDVVEILSGKEEQISEIVSAALQQKQELSTSSA